MDNAKPKKTERKIMSVKERVNKAFEWGVLILPLRFAIQLVCVEIDRLEKMITELEEKIKNLKTGEK